MNVHGEVNANLTLNIESKSLHIQLESERGKMFSIYSPVESIEKSSSYVTGCYGFNSIFGKIPTR